MIDHVKSGSRDIIPEDTPPKLPQLITACWSSQRTDRLTAIQVTQQIDKLIKENEGVLEIQLRMLAVSTLVEKQDFMHFYDTGVHELKPFLIGTYFFQNILFFINKRLKCTFWNMDIKSGFVPIFYQILSIATAR